jgi:hypothetical protein
VIPPPGEARANRRVNEAAEAVRPSTPVGASRGNSCSARNHFCSARNGFPSLFASNASFSVPRVPHKSLISLRSKISQESRFEENQRFNYGFCSARVFLARLGPHETGDQRTDDKRIRAKRRAVNVLFGYRTLLASNLLTFLKDRFTLARAKRNASAPGPGFDATGRKRTHTPQQFVSLFAPLFILQTAFGVDASRFRLVNI